MTMIRDTREYATFGGDDFKDDVGSIDDHVWYFWFAAQKYARTRGGWMARKGYNITDDDLDQFATETLLYIAQALGPRFESGEFPLDSRMFWHFFTQKIDWALNDLLRDAYRIEHITVRNTAGEEAEDPADVRTQLRVHVDNSMLLDDIVDDIERMEPMEQFTLAITVYEEAKQSQLAHVLGIHNSDVSAMVRAARQRVLALALNRVSTKRYTVGAPSLRFIRNEDRAEEWTQETYGIDLRHYLHNVATLYRVDVFYIARIIDNAHGLITKNGMVGKPSLTLRKLTDEQVRDIRARRAAGEIVRTIAESHGIGHSTVQQILDGKSYADVA
jgi:hypothetical protein